MFEKVFQRESGARRRRNRRETVDPSATVAAGSGTANQLLVCGELSMNPISMFATFWRPVVDGCVPSDCRSLASHVSPSLRGFSPSAHRYGPHAIHGAEEL